MADLAISFIVEGHGELDAVPILARRVCLELAPERYVEFRKPIRASRDRLVRNPEQLRKSLLLARQKALQSSENARVFVILDADDDCPVGIADVLRAKAIEVLPAECVHVVLAKTEFESWFLASADSLARLRGLPEDLTAPNDPESIRGAKEWLTRKMGERGRYRETTDQAAFAARMSIAHARENSPSFCKFCRELQRALGP